MISMILSLMVETGGKVAKNILEGNALNVWFACVCYE